MIEIWFLMELMSYQNVPVIAYKGFGGYLEKEQCEDKRVIVENQIVNYEMQRGNIVYVETYCMEMETFKTSLKKKGTGA